ncbi:MAG: hypothetical protein AB7P99_16905 [Vicinamibacterales bacterium]
MSATAVCVAAAGMVAFGQATPQNPTTTQRPTTQQEPQQPTTRAQAGAAAEQQVTVSGCIVREADFRRTQDAGRGGAASTGVGTGNEFVLTNAMMGGGAAGGRAVGTTGAAATAFELSGDAEGEAARFVGRRVEISGMLKAQDSAQAGGPTANAPLSNDLELREIDVMSVRASSSSEPCN